MFLSYHNVNLPRNEKPQIEILNREEQQRLMYVSTKFRYGVFIRFTLATGLRLGELVALRWEDLDTKKSMISIRRTLNRLPKIDYNGVGNSTEIVIQEPKTKNSIRSIPVLRVILDEILQWRNVQLADAHTAGSAYCGMYGVDSSDVELLLRWGYSCDEVEEMLMDTNLLHEALRDIKFMCGEAVYEECCGGAW